MSNINNVYGARITNSLVSEEVQSNKYVTSSADATPLYIGDFVKTNNASDAFGTPICTKASAAEPLRGIVMGFEPLHTEPQEGDVYRRANEVRTVIVCDDPYIQFSIQVNGTLTINDFGKNTDIVLGTSSNSTGLSGTEIDLTTIVTTSAQLKILTLLDVVSNELGENSEVIAMIHDHELQHTSTSLGDDIWDRTGTTIVPANAGDTLDMGSGVITTTGDIFGDNATFTGKLTVGGLIDPTGIILNPQIAAPSSDNGTIYYNSGSGTFKFREAGVWVDHDDFVLLAGRSGGQQIFGGTGSGESIKIEPTLHPTKGPIILGSVPSGVIMGNIIHIGAVVDIEAQEGNFLTYRTLNPITKITSQNAAIVATGSASLITDAGNATLETISYANSHATFPAANRVIWSGSSTGLAFGNSTTNFLSMTLDGRIGISGANTNVSAALEINSSSLVFLPSRLTNTTLVGLTKVNGMLAYNTDETNLQTVHNGSWTPLLTASGNISLDANWNIGANSIVGDVPFISVSVTGTEPFQVSSQTLVNNLNADFLDGLEGAAYSLINGTRAFTGTVSGVLPTDASHLTTQEYVDITASSFLFDFFFNNNASDLGGIYYDMTDTDLGGGESTISTAGLAGGNDQAIGNFATLVAEPNLPTMPSGIYSSHIHIERTAGTRSLNVYFELYERTSPGGVETLRASSEVSGEITTKTEIDLHASILTDVDINISDRWILKWKANIGSTGSNVTVTLYQEGVNSSRFTAPTTSQILNDIYLRQDGTKPLTANWDVGGFALTDISGGAFGTTVNDRVVEINHVTGECLRTTYNDANGSAANYVDYHVTSGGQAIITPSGAVFTIAGDIISDLSGTDGYINALDASDVEKVRFDTNGDSWIRGGDLDLEGHVTFSESGKIDWTKYTADSVTLAVGATTSLVADLQTANDGNYYHIDEVNATPAINLIIDFVSVNQFQLVDIIATYVGSAMDANAIQLFNWNTTSWDTFGSIQHQIADLATANGKVLSKYSFMIPDDTKYIGTAGNAGKVRVRLFHPMAGNNTHDLDVDVVALYQ